MIVLLIIQLIIGILLITTIVMQMQGSGLSSAFGGTGGVYRSKRSAEKLLYIATIILSFLFAVISIILLLQK